MGRVLKLLAGGAGPYVLGAVVALVVSLATSTWFAARGWHKCATAMTVAQAESRAAGAESGLEVTVATMERIDEERPAVDDAVDRIDRVCVPRDLPVPASTPVDAGAREAPRNDRNDEDRVFVEKMKRDLRHCSEAVQRCNGRVDWMIDNGAADRPR